jgi:hypothetical protein
VRSPDRFCSNLLRSQKDLLSEFPVSRASAPGASVMRPGSCRFRNPEASPALLLDQPGI